MKKRILCLLLVSVFLLSFLVACGSDGNTEESATSATTGDVEETTAETEPEATLNTEDTLQEYNFGGKEYNILSRANTSYEFEHENSHGLGTVDTAIFTRNEEVASRFNVKIRTSTETGGWYNDTSPFGQKYQAISSSGWSEFQLMSDHFAMQQKYSINGYCRDLTTLVTVDMTKEWWSEEFYENCNIEGKFYVAIGDITYTFYEYMQVFFFNETMAEQMLLDATGEPIDLYQMVRDYEWTFEKLKEYTKLVSTTSGIEQYGLMLNAHSVRSFATSCEIDYMEKTGEGTNVKYSFPTEASADAIQKVDDIVGFFRTQDGISIKNNKNDGADEGNLNPYFYNGDALFYPQMLGQIVPIGENILATVEFGILPFPLYNEDQLEYHTTFRDTLSAISVPRNVENLDLAGVVTEALCMYSYNLVRPTYLEGVIGDRYLGDQNLRDMMEIIRNSTSVDFAMAYSGSLGFPFSTLSHLTNVSEETSFATSYASGASSKQTRLDDIYKAFGVK